MPAILRLSALSLLVCVLANPLPSQSQAASAKPAGELPPDVSETLQMQVTIDAGFKKPAGAKLRFSKMEDTHREGIHYFRYRVYAVGAPEDIPLVLSFFKIGTSYHHMLVISSTAYVNRKGLVFTKKPTPEQRDSDKVTDGTELDVEIQAAKGEPARFVLRKQDNTVIIAGTVVPAPIESTDQGCKLSALLAAPEGAAVLLYADGFPPNTDLTLLSSSAGKPNESKQHTDAKGHTFIIEFPGVPGKNTGIVTETVQSKGCSPSVQIPWGKGTYHPL